nr:fused MFS/spermidine synthase [Gammaproteobacteria bacterium]
MGRWLQLVMLSAREALVFITGATTLSLEVLASRVMTPYFGVSLYIWASILATTLAFLALGYGAGGLVSRRCDAKTLRIGFFSAPIVAACAMVLACAVYPVLFVRLAQADLVVGSFVASTFLLAVPLILFSAMNPLLVSLEQKDHPGAAAGRVFFISTLGSVLGVLVTAFAMIPYLTNFRGILLTAIVVLVATVMISRDLAPVALRSIRIAAALVGGLALALAIGRDSYLAVLDAGNPQSGRYRIVDESTSVFGNVKIVERLDRNRMPVERILLQEGLVQNRVGPNQESLSPYTDVLSALARRHHSKPDAVLILGLGAGIVAEELARTDWRVTAVEINADTAELAKRYFGLGDRVRTVVADARTFVRGCPGGPYPVVIVDLFQGDFAPDYLFTREFFSDVSHCAGPKGKVIM